MQVHHTNADIFLNVYTKVIIFIGYKNKNYQ